MLKSLQFFLLIFCKSGKIVIISPYTAFIIKATKVNNHFKKEGAKYDDNINQVYEENHGNCYGCHGAFSAAGKRSAHERHDAPPPRHSDRYDRHDRYDKHDRYDRHDRYDKRHKNDNYVTKKDSNKKATTSFIIGAVLGAVIAKNT